MTAWVLVADASRARIFSADKSFSELQELQDFAHPESRLHEQSMQSDRPGRVFDSAGDGRHAMGKENPPKKHEATRFAKTLCEHINMGRARGDFEKLYIIAAPAFLGELRQGMNPTTQKAVVEEVSKNLATQSVEEIRAQLPQFL
ncbi:Protein required for attachment to host cells [Ectothiorhodosinus mongolicus]|uniref:Protein required for attachment to host cells n=1 Tax=Ectothiorhodosinus mongolicus TaxID=233100 RepID=A0A1R3VMN3_9GAMM|nr:host attachment protein [Ectothiorhodosinus mongolicus]ULX56329.1 host attachment protein [Ectothiorhodosinus mongolicus]SIT65841.1 Protein required for attachment to host cells [Ectothiorhodosinus mongolicus]